MPVTVNIDGAWKTKASTSVNIDGVWKTVNGIFINVGGVWKPADDAVITRTSLYAEYLCDQTAGTYTLVDTSGNVRDISFPNSGYGNIMTDGKVGNRLAITGNGSYPVVGRHAYNFTDMTISGWVRIPNTYTFAGLVMMNDETSGIGQGGFYFGLSTTGGLSLFIGTSDTSNTSRSGLGGLSSPLSNGVWYHIVLRKTGTTWCGFLNGVKAIADFTATVFWNNGTYGATNNGIGGFTRYDGGIASYIADYDLIRVYNRALTDAEIIAIYNNGG